MISAKIVVEGDLSKIFKPEEKEFPNKRASYSLIVKNNKTHFDIKATDSTALRAVLNSISRILIVYEKAK